MGDGDAEAEKPWWWSSGLPGPPGFPGLANHTIEGQNIFDFSQELDEVYSLARLAQPSGQTLQARLRISARQRTRRICASLKR